jgi:hypothetical protein
MADSSEPKKFQFAVGTPQGKILWRRICEDKMDIIRQAFSGRSDAAWLQTALETVRDVSDLTGYLRGVVEGYDAARCLLKDDGATAPIVRIIRRHPDWTTLQICRKIDTLKNPPKLPWKGSTRGLWVDALNDPNSRLAQNVEKYISRIRVAARRIREAKKYKNYVATGILT